MVRTEDAVIARFERDSEKFELLVDPNLAMDLKNGKEINFNELLAIDTIFKDAKKGEEKSEETTKQIFGTNDIKEIATKIISEGEVQLTTAQRKEILEKKRKEVITFIAQNALNPQTNAPHPPARIETAMEEARIHIDLNKNLKEQVEIVVKEIRKKIPISFEKLQIAAKIPATYTGKAQPLIRKYQLIKEEWQKDGSLVALFEIPAGLKMDLINELNHLTHGAVETKIIEK
jgi:ribosome maturation protein SDO1